MNPSLATHPAAIPVHATASPPSSVGHILHRVLHFKLALAPLVLGPFLLAPWLCGSLEAAASGGVIAHFFAQLVAVSLLAAAVVRSAKRGPSALRLGYAAPVWLAAVLGVTAAGALLDLQAANSDYVDPGMQLKLALSNQAEGFATLTHLGAGLSALLFVLALLWLFAPAPPAARADRTGVRWVLPGFAGLFAAALIAGLSLNRGQFDAPAMTFGLSLGAMSLGAASSFALWRSDRRAEPTRAGGEALWVATLTSFGAALALVATNCAAERMFFLRSRAEMPFDEPMTAADLDFALFPHSWPLNGLTLLLSLFAAAPVLLAALLHRTPEDETRPLTPVLARGGLIGAALPVALLVALASAVYSPQLRERPAAIAAARQAAAAEQAEREAAAAAEQAEREAAAAAAERDTPQP